MITKNAASTHPTVITPSSLVIVPVNNESAECVKLEHAKYELMIVSHNRFASCLRGDMVFSWNGEPTTHVYTGELHMSFILQKNDHKPLVKNS
jgi:hypothetical protein